MYEMVPILVLAQVGRRLTGVLKFRMEKNTLWRDGEVSTSFGSEAQALRLSTGGKVVMASDILLK